MEILTDRLGVDDRKLAEEITETADWHHVAAGSAVETGLAMLVVTGLFRVDGQSGASSSHPCGHVIGAGTSLSAGSPRTIAVAERDSTFVSIDATTLQRLVSKSPSIVARLLPGSNSSLPILGDHRIRVVTLIGGVGVNKRVLSSRIGSAMEQFANVQILWPERADLMVDRPGASREERGEPGDLMIKRLIDNAETEHDHLILEATASPTPWTRRALSIADEVVLYVRSGMNEDEAETLLDVLDHCPLHTPRLVVVEHGASEIGPPTGTARLLDLLGIERAIHVRRGASFDRLARLVAGKGRGLVLSGGGARGFAHLGVYRALRELGYEIDIFGGASIGSPLAAGMADEMEPDQLDETVDELFSRVLDYTIPVVALVRGDRIARATARVFDDRGIEDLRRRYFCVSTNLTTSATHRHLRGSVVHAVRASTAIPGVMPPVPHGEELLIDAGVSNNLPVDVMRDETPNGETIAVDTAPRKGPSAREDFGLSVSGAAAFRQRLAGKRTHPRITSTLLRALTVGANQHRDREQIESMTDLSLELDLAGVPLLDFKSTRAVARMGYEASMPILEAWMEERRQT